MNRREFISLSGLASVGAATAENAAEPQTPTAEQPKPEMPKDPRADAPAAVSTEEKNLWESCKGFTKPKDDVGIAEIIGAAAIGVVVAKTILDDAEPSPTSSQMDSIRKHEEECQRRREEHEKMLDSLPPGERRLQREIDKLKFQVAEQQSDMNQMQEDYERKISELECDISEIED